ncbi:MAG TPA: DUF1294 domain-containing protein [Terricaulis sp.]|nr:DUF1294 domain-containing protein [Terricaulis sp.]
MLGWIAWLGYAAINIAAFAAFADDKRRAVQNRQRLPEADLLALAAFGGALGALLGQQIFRHKTRKQPFRAKLIAAAIANVAIAILLLTPDLRNALWRMVLQLVALAVQATQ